MAYTHGANNKKTYNGDITNTHSDSKKRQQVEFRVQPSLLESLSLKHGSDRLSQGISQLTEIPYPLILGATRAMWHTMSFMWYALRSKKEFYPFCMATFCMARFHFVMALRGFGKVSLAASQFMGGISRIYLGYFEMYAAMFFQMYSAVSMKNFFTSTPGIFHKAPIKSVAPLSASEGKEDLMPIARQLDNDNSSGFDLAPAG